MTAAAAVAITAATPAWGQEQDQRGPDTSGGTGTETRDAFNGIPDIVVTARKIEERLQDAPVAVSVVGAETINQLGLTSLDDFARQTTGLSFSQAFGRSTDRPVIRGQSNVLAGVQAGVETGAAFFIDGVYYQGDIQGFDPQSIERVEVIKGPQSALYGRNTYAVRSTTLPRTRAAASRSAAVRARRSMTSMRLPGQYPARCWAKP
jgi:outer membrane receptor protein involved in Fe transport